MLIQYDLAIVKLAYFNVIIVPSRIDEISEFGSTTMQQWSEALQIWIFSEKYTNFEPEHLQF